jgi:hypothetical protein
VERTITDSSDVSVALADSDHGGEDALYRRPAPGAGSFQTPAHDETPPRRKDEPLSRRKDDPLPRRKPARRDASSRAADDADTVSWDAFAAGSSTEDGREQAVPEPPFGPAPPATGGRTGYGFTAGPISGNWRPDAPVSGAPTPQSSGTPTPPQRPYGGEHAAITPSRHASGITAEDTGAESRHAVRDEDDFSATARLTRRPRQAARPQERDRAGDWADEDDYTATARLSRRSLGINPPRTSRTPRPSAATRANEATRASEAARANAATRISEATRTSEATHTSEAARANAVIRADDGPRTADAVRGAGSGRDAYRQTSRRPAERAPRRRDDRGLRRREEPLGFDDSGIGDLVGSNPHEIRPHRATSTGPRHGRGVQVAGAVLTVAVAVGATVAGIAYYSGDGGGITSVLENRAAQKPQREVTAPIDGRSAAEFELASAVNKVTVRTEDLGENLYRMTTSEESGMLPQPALSRSKVQLKLSSGGIDGTGEVEVVLSTRVRWTLRFSGAADEQVLALGGGQVRAIDFTGGARRTDIQLPEAAGTVPLKLSGAVDELTMRAPLGNPVRVQMKGGAQAVVAGATTLKDLAPGSTLTPKNWSVDDRYDVEADERLLRLTVETL